MNDGPPGGCPLLQKLYVVGSTEDRSCHRILKVDRTISHGDDYPLVEEDDGEYSEAEVKELIYVLNRCSGDGRGLEEVATACGIVGLVRFLEGYYLILITKRKL